jgi:hypothetical protein
MAPLSRAFVPPCNLNQRSPALGPDIRLATDRNPSQLFVDPQHCCCSRMELSKFAELYRAVHIVEN